MRISTTAILQFSLRGLSAVLGILALMYFGNVLGSEKIGTYSLAMTLSVWLLLVANPGITSALVKRISEGKDQDELFAASLLICFTIIAVVTGIVLLFEPYINSYVGMDVTMYIVALLVLKALFLLIISTIKGQNRVATASIIRFAERALRPLIQVGAILVGMGVVGLLFGYVASLAIGSAIGVIFVSTVPSRPSREHFNRLLSFGLFSVMGNIRSRAARWTDTAVLGFFVANDLIGVYEIAWSVALLLILATDSLTSSIFPKASELSQEGDQSNIIRLTESGILYTGIVAIPGVIGSMIIGRDLLRLFGPEFDKGIIVLPILVLWSLIVSYDRMLQTTINALDRPDLTFNVNLLYALTNVAGNVLLVYFFGWVGAAIATTGAAFLAFFLTVAYINELINITYPINEIAKQFFATGVMAFTVYPVHLATTDLPREYVFIPITVGAITYFVVLFAVSSPVRSRVYNIKSAI